MTENELVELGFEKVLVPVEESGAKNDFWYYNLDIGELSFISGDNEDSGTKMWMVQIFDNGPWISKFEDLEALITIIKKYTK